MTAVLPSTDRTTDAAADLRVRLAALEDRVRAAVALRRERDGDPDDRFRGLYITDDQVDRMLDEGWLSIGGLGASPALGHDGVRVNGAGARTDGTATIHVPDQPTPRLHGLAQVFGLDVQDLAILLVAVAPDVDARFERLYAYLQDDVTRRRPSVGLALELCGLSSWSVAARRRLSAGSIMARWGLIELETLDRPALTRTIRVPDRVLTHLLGGDEPDDELRSLLAAPEPVEIAEAVAISEAFTRGVRLAYLRDRVGAATAAAGGAAHRARGRTALQLDLTSLASRDDPERLTRLAVREAALLRAGLVAGPIDAPSPRLAAVLRELADAPLPVVLFGSVPWDPDWAPHEPWLADAPELSSATRARLWHVADPDTAARMAAFRLAPEQILRARRSAEVRALARGEEPDLADLQAGARSENASGLDRLARRVEPRASWADLVVPHAIRTQLGELASRARRRDIVLDEWRLGGGATHGRGVTALFAGDPGTGKTLSAEVVAAEIGLDLYVIDLSSVVDKYIGETEKNLDRIFRQADRINGVLLFDEADALFGQRSEVRDARDRYANVEIAYLLQRMEQFDGLAILTTNLRANIDEAFLRRLDVVIDFPVPEEEERLAIWSMHLPARVPIADDVDLPFMAAHFRISGGHIRNICLTAAYLAAERDQRVSMADIVRGAEREYAKLGRLTVEAEFGPYLGLLGRSERSGRP
jgi:hypothetical protein